jgi:hypothetical protein
MSKNDLKNIVKREKLSDNHRANFESKLKTHQEKSNTPWWKYSSAAAVFLLFFSVLFISKPNESIAKEAKMYKETKFHFENLIRYEIEKLNTSDPDSVSQKQMVGYLKEINKLGEECKKLEKEFEESNFSPSILKHIIENYQLRLEILNNLLLEIERNKKQKSHEQKTI